ncbi:cytochrome P450 [Hyalangium versicolor]|uniref:cytochrome P450 n=1 Tax=Hyalangium versicolor TaxID=2861190 RepID=UPI001CCD9401|nr:cytochrome P450 [Hyalangium versicolor]
MSQPTDPLAAVTHPDPYPYYAELASHRALQRVPGLDMWIAADARTVREVLSSRLCRVRPASEPVPAHLRHAASGGLFGSLVRMNDSPHHSDVKRALGTTLLREIPSFREESRRWARTLFAEPELSQLPDRALAMPIFVVASLLGVPSIELENTREWVDAYVRSVTAPALTQAGSAGAARLMEQLDAARGAAHRTRLLEAFTEEARRLDCPAELLTPNAVGLLTQTYEATAGLIGCTLLALARSPGLCAQAVSGDTQLEDIVREAARHDAPVQNTRRFVAETGMIADQVVERGETILVLLAAANRDPQVNPSPEEFIATRPDRCLFTFGVGAHACPGEALAVTLASAAVERVLETGVDLMPLTKGITYRPSMNARVLGGVP